MQDPCRLPDGDRKKRDAWWEKQRKEGLKARKRLKEALSAKEGTMAWGTLHGPDIVDNARVNHPEWFGMGKVPMDGRNTT